MLWLIFVVYYVLSCTRKICFEIKKVGQGLTLTSAGSKLLSMSGIGYLNIADRFTERKRQYVDTFNQAVAEQFAKGLTVFGMGELL